LLGLSTFTGYINTNTEECTHGDRDAQVLLVERVLSELARDPGSGKFKDLQQQKDDQQLQPMESVSSWSQGGGGTNP